MPRLQRLSEDHFPAYEAFLAGVSGRMLHYSLPYRRMLEDVLGCQSDYWIAVEGNTVTGVLPIMTRDGTFGRVVNSLPFFGSHGGPLATDADACGLLLDEFLELAKEPDVAAAMYVSNPWSSVDIDRLVRSAVGEVFSDHRIGQMTPLPACHDDEEGIGDALFACFDPSARRNIRKARKEGIEVRIDNTAIPFLCETHNQNMQEIGGNTKPQAFFDSFPRRFKPDSEYCIYVAEKNGSLVAALLIFLFNDMVEYFVPVTKASARNSQPMAAIVFQAMKDAARAGRRVWNWGGTWPAQQGVYRFKKKWGAQDRRYDYAAVVKNRDLLHRSSAELTAAYPGFYIVPFDQLKVT